MEKLGPITLPHAALNAARTIPVGRGWVMEPLDTGFLLKALALGAQVRISTEEAQSLRDGQIAPQDLAARHGLNTTLHPPGSAVTIAFSDEARRLAGTGRSDRGKGGGAGAGGPNDQPGPGIPLPSPLTLSATLIAIGIVVLALGL